MAADRGQQLIGVHRLEKTCLGGETDELGAGRASGGDDDHGNGSQRGIGGLLLAKLLADVQSRGRGLIKVTVEVMDDKEVLALTAGVQWFIARREGDGR